MGNNTAGKAWPIHMWRVVDLGLLPYMAALDLQHRMVQARYEGNLGEDTVLLLEHPSVYTLGRNGGLENLKASPELLKEMGVPVVRTMRGGDITYHGPGQIIAYPIIDLRTDKIGVFDYVSGLEEVMIRVAQDHGIEAQRNALNHGVWIEGKKVGSIGLAIRHGIAFHGLALNVDLSLTYFSWINACGLKDISMTSLKQAGVKNIDIKLVKNRIVSHMEEVFGVKAAEWKSGDFLREFPLILQE